jgi:serine/threonine protein kinase
MMAQPKVDPLLDTMVGNYRITRKLGSGAMGTVYLAEHRDVGKRIAVKVLAGHLTEDSSMVGRFMLEAKAIGRLQHPGIVEMFDFGELEDGRSYYTMEYLEGETLSMRIHRGRMTIGEILSILDQVCDALTVIHAKGIIHRDLKPGNIFLALKGNHRVIKILDFGIAKMQASARLGNDPLTSTGTVLGTPVYMSPEQAMGENESISGLSDIYSLGVVLYKILTGQYPIIGTAIHEVVAYHFKHDTIPLRDFNPGVPEPLASVVMKALSKKPQQRQAFPMELFHDFRGACVHLPQDLSFDGTSLGTPAASASFVGQDLPPPDSDLWNIEISQDGPLPPPPPPPEASSTSGHGELSAVPAGVSSGSGVNGIKQIMHFQPRWAYGGIAFLLVMIGVALALISGQKQKRRELQATRLELDQPRILLARLPVKKKDEDLKNKFIIRTTPEGALVKVKFSSGGERTHRTPLDLTLSEGESCEMVFSREGYRDSTISLRFDAAIVVREIYQELVPLAVVAPPPVSPGAGKTTTKPPVSVKPPVSKGMRHERRTLGDGVL